MTLQITPKALESMMKLIRESVGKILTNKSPTYTIQDGAKTAVYLIELPFEINKEF